MQALRNIQQESELYPQGLKLRPAARPRNAERPRLQVLSAATLKDVRKKKPALMEFHTVKRIDNSRLVRHIEPVKMKNLYKTAGLGAIMAVFCMFYIFDHFRCIDLSFQLEDMKAKQVAAASYNGQLKLEIATLRDPRRIDVIARHQLGLTQASPAQVLEYSNPDGSEVAAARFVRPNRVP